MLRNLAFAVAALSLSACMAPPPPEDGVANGVAVGVAEEGLSVCPGKTTLEGVDVSTYQGTVNWTQVKASGRAFAITRVGDGLGGDDTFDANWKGIKAAGMIRGAYQFFRASDDPIQQADILLGKIGTPADGDLPPTMDLEVTDGQSNATVIANAKKWLAYVKMKSGRTPMVYIAPGFASTLGNPDFSAYVLWVAHWGVTCPTVPSGWTTWAFHQYSDSGSVSGISGAVDLDVFNGDETALKALASNPQTTPPPDMAHSGSDGGTHSADGGTVANADMGSDNSGGGGAGGGSGTGGNGDTGGAADSPGNTVTPSHGCDMGGHASFPWPALLVVLAFVSAIRPRRSRDAAPTAEAPTRD